MVVPPNVGGIDVNLPAITADGEEEMVVSSPNSTVSSVSHGKRSAEREENEAEEDGGDAAERKKLRLSKEQSAMLEETFKEYNTLNQVSGIFGNFVCYMRVVLFGRCCANGVIRLFFFCFFVFLFFRSKKWIWRKS